MKTGKKERFVVRAKNRGSEEAYLHPQRLGLRSIDDAKVHPSFKAAMKTLKAYVTRTDPAQIEYWEVVPLEEAQQMELFNSVIES